jgi:hypothetical protein
MKRLPLIISIILGVICILCIIGVSIIPISIIYLLGGNKPFDLYAEVFVIMDRIIFNE